MIIHLRPLLGQQLKDPGIIELLELFDADVIYSFDRVFEGQPDRYYASIAAEGLEFRFDENQRLATIFVYVQGNDIFSARDLTSSDIAVFGDANEVIEFAQKNGLPYKANLDNPNVPTWVRVDEPKLSIHYQFGADNLGMVTLMLPSAVPGAA